MSRNQFQNPLQATSWRIQQALALAIGLLGTYVIAGWLSGQEAMVRVLPNSSGLVLNAAILFVVAGLCLWPSAAPAAPPGRGADARAIGIGLLILLPGAILYEHWRDVSLGIDWISLHATVNDGNPRPGRAAPNTCVGFLFAGVALLMLRRERRSAPTLWLTLVLVYSTLAIGVSGLAGYLLRLEVLYYFAGYHRMPAPTAGGMTLLGIGLGLQLHRSRSAAELQHPDRSIVRTAAVVLTVAALGAGILSATVLKNAFEDDISEGFLRTTRTTANTLASIIEQRVDFGASIARRPGLQKHLLRLGADPHDAEALSLAREVGNSVLMYGVSGIRFFNARGEWVADVGSPIQQPEMEIPLQHAGLKLTLLWWQNGFVLRTEEVAVRDGEAVGKVIAEQPLPALKAMLRSADAESPSADTLLCGREKDDAACFPSRFYEANLHIPMFKDGKPYLAISRALLGQTGVLKVTDLRGIPVLAGYAPLADLGLGMVLKTDSADLFAPIRRGLDQIAGLLVLLIVAGTLLLRAQIQPLARRLITEQRRSGAAR